MQSLKPGTPGDMFDLALDRIEIVGHHGCDLVIRGRCAEASEIGHRNRSGIELARTLRIADGPDEVHRVLIAKNVIGAYEHGDGWDFGN